MRVRLVARAAIAAVALCAITATLWSGWATHASRGDPRRAARLAPFDARIAVLAAQAGDARAPALTDRALARDVTIPAAIELRALRAEAAGDASRGARLFALSDAISRRSLATRTWLIQRAVDRGDVPGALEQFDIALRTSSTAPRILFPVLAQASTDPALAEPIARVLDRPQEWRIMFLRYAIGEGGAASSIADVVLRMRDRRAITDAGIDQALVAALVSQEAFGQARRTDEAFHPSPGSRGAVVDPEFSPSHAAYPFGWALTERGEAGASRARVQGRPVLAYQALAGGSGPVAVQLLTLPAAAYRLATRTATGAADPGAAPFWTLTCGQGGGTQIALLDQPDGTGAVAAAAFVVPPDCPAQWLVLHLRASDEGSQAGAIARVWVDRL